MSCEGGGAVLTHALILKTVGLSVRAVVKNILCNPFNSWLHVAEWLGLLLAARRLLTQTSSGFLWGVCMFSLWILGLPPTAQTHAFCVCVLYVFTKWPSQYIFDAKATLCNDRSSAAYFNSKRVIALLPSCSILDLSFVLCPPTLTKTVQN